MDTVFIYAIIAVAAFWLGWNAAAAWNQLAFREILRDLGISNRDLQNLAQRQGWALADSEVADTEPELPEVEVRLEQHQGQIYAFTVAEDRFLGQGRDRDQLIEHIQKNLNNVRLRIDEGADLIREQ